MFPFCSNIHLISFTVFVQVALKRYSPTITGYAGGNGAVAGFAGYAANWYMGNYGGDVIDNDATYENVTLPDESEGDFVSDDLIKEAYKMLSDARNSLAENGVDPMEFEAGASFRIRRHFWSGKEYVSTKNIALAAIDQNNYGISFGSYKGDHFRMHLHPKEMSVGMGKTAPFHPSAMDYNSARVYGKYGIQSYVGAIRGNSNELYRYTYNHGSPKFWKTVW